MAFGKLGAFEEVLIDGEVGDVDAFAVDLLCWWFAEHGAADLGVGAVCADEEVVRFDFLAFRECYGDTVVLLREAFDGFVVDHGDFVEDWGDEDVGEGAAEDLILGCHCLHVCPAGGHESRDGASIGVDERHAGLFGACISDLLLYAGPFNDIDGVGANINAGAG